MEPPQEEQESAVFNMALDTLKRLGTILSEIKGLAYKTEYSREIIQEVKIILVKQFFVQASPLLPADTIKKYQTEVLKLVPKTKVKYSGGLMSAGKPKRIEVIYDGDLEIKCDEILIELQMILQKEKYFMPSAEEEGDF